MAVDDVPVPGAKVLLDEPLVDLKGASRAGLSRETGSDTGSDTGNEIYNETYNGTSNGTDEEDETQPRMSKTVSLRDFQILSRDYNVKLSNEFYIAKVIMASNNAAAAAADAALKAAVNAACDATCEAATASAAAAQAIHDLGPTAVAGTVADYAAGAASFAAEAASQAAHALFNARSTNSAISLGHLDQARDLAGHAQEAADHAIDAALDAAANASAAKAAAAGRS
ncbi:hypothetical protein, variant [Gaeumannomyces tritici R3-111a-1]|uniref:Uncharacterized protein n=1 Tax=Gaeumannomyces tritici (strain R3-111a-1) TaxID=644352 RepID=J3P3C6_GAET3|nr:hypothetical protein, variant [Gaeumannomyces tritici R3-111a-1]EJT74167.1 hypothetical protein, variant [Gaeumannomyces tritici R3-111a-1]